ncbi:DUF2336 domain-containing protein [Minwuia thermotolerans]|nr:DUF2336 domain-containing protein [Minwuia thermotolerans]
MSEMISEGDVQALVGALSEDQKGAVSAQLGRFMQRSGLDRRELTIALEMIDRLIADSVESVRKGLAEHIAESPWLPRPMVERLLADVEQVALPIVSFSSLLGDRDLLVQIERGGNFQEAVAGRRAVSAPVAEKLVEKGTEKAVGILIRNPGAEVSERVLDRAVDRFQDSTDVMGAVASRPGLPLEVAERLVSLTVTEQCVKSVADLMMQTLIRRHDLPAVLAEDLVVHGRERSIVQLARGADNWQAVEDLAKRMHAAGRLSTSLMLRVLASGDHQFFIAGMAQLTRWPRDKVEAAVDAAGVDSFRRLFEQSGLEPLLFHAFRVARDEMRAARGRQSPAADEDFIERVVGRIAEEYRNINPAGLEQVLSRLRAKANRDRKPA